VRLSTRLLCAPLACAIFVYGVLILPSQLVPGYSDIHDSVSDMGQVGSPTRLAFRVVLMVLAVCTVCFADALREIAVRTGTSSWTAILVGMMAIALGGAAVFAYPHRLHMFFALPELIAYQAPLVFALTWRHEPRAKRLVAQSWGLYLLLTAVTFVNLSGPLGMNGLWGLVKPRIGLAQRMLFIIWFGWCTLLAKVFSSPNWQLATTGVERRSRSGGWWSSP